MTQITRQHVDYLYDASETMAVAAHMLGNASVYDHATHSLSWLLGSAHKRLGDAISVVSQVQERQERAAQPVADPLLSIIEAYLAGCYAFEHWRDTNPDADETTCDVIERTYGASLTALEAFEGVATTKAGALAAIRLVADGKNNGVGNCEETRETLLNAAIAYFEKEGLHDGVSH